MFLLKSAFVATATVLSHAVAASDADESCSRPAIHPSFPPPGSNATEFFLTNEAVLPPSQPLSERERELVNWSAETFVANRRAGTVSCEEFARALTNRAEYYRTANVFMNWDNDPDWTARVVEAAKVLDDKASKDGVEALAPLYCLPIPAKGTMATQDFKSSAGVGILHDLTANRDCAMIELVKDLNGVVFGKTNVPEFAASIVTCNYGSYNRCVSEC